MRVYQCDNPECQARYSGWHAVCKTCGDGFLEAVEEDEVSEDESVAA